LDWYLPEYRGLFFGDYLGIKPFEAADYLKSDEDAAQYV